MIETVLIFLRNIQNSSNEYIAGVLLLRGGCPPSYEHTNNGIIEFCHSLSPPVHITTSAKCRSWFGTGSQEPTISAMSCGTSYTSRSSYMLLMRCRSHWPPTCTQPTTLRFGSETFPNITQHFIRSVWCVACADDPFFTICMRYDDLYAPRDASLLFMSLMMVSGMYACLSDNREWL